MPVHGGPEISVTTTIISSPERYRGRWLVGTNKGPSGTVQGGEGGGLLAARMHSEVRLTATAAVVKNGESDASN